MALDPVSAHREAWRCLQCGDAPCTAACPAHVPIPEFIARFRTGDLVGAEELLRGANPLISTCGEICPDEQYCTRACLLRGAEGPIRIRELHRFVTESAHAPWPTWTAWHDEPVAVVGAGPAGISCARELACLGYHVSVYEREALPGGIVRYYLAASRFDGHALERDLAPLASAPLTWHAGTPVTSLKAMLERYRAVFWAPGTHREVTLGLPDEGLVTSGMAFLRSFRTGTGPDLTGKDVVVVGGGNVSLDVCLTAHQAGASTVVLLYRRGPREMRVWRRELEEALAAGIVVEYFARPSGLIVVDGRVRALMCRRTRLVREGDERPSPKDVEGFDFTLPTGEVIRAIGSQPTHEEDVDVRWGSKATLPVDADMATATRGLFAGGDVVSREGTVVAAVSHGLRAARAMHRFLRADSP